MTIEADLFARCKAVSGITSIFGTGNDCRIWESEIPRENNTWPAARFELISGDEPSMMGSDSGKEFNHYRFLVFGETQYSAKAAMRAIRTGLKRYRATGTVTIDDIIARNPQELGREPDSQLFMCSVDFIVIFSE